jgi:hypothetical protein
MSIDQVVQLKTEYWAEHYRIHRRNCNKGVKSLNPGAPGQVTVRRDNG